MDEFGCDYECRTVGESIIKYNIPNDWSAEFDAYERLNKGNRTQKRNSSLFPLLQIAAQADSKGELLTIKLPSSEGSFLLAAI